MRGHVGLSIDRVTRSMYNAVEWLELQEKRNAVFTNSELQDIHNVVTRLEALKCRILDREKRQLGLT